MKRRTILTGDAFWQLTTVAAGTVDMVLTSPPYFRLRDYGQARQLGAEANIEDWVREVRAVAAEVGRVLTPTGTFWLNLGDTYATHPSQGARRKSLLLGPERVALALVRDGWVLRSKVVWHKPNPMPTSVRDRLTASWELVYIFARSDRYYFDLDSIRVPHRSKAAASRRPEVHEPTPWRGANAAGTSGLDQLKAAGRVGHPLGRNPSDVWTIANGGIGSHHRATFPLRLASRAILAGCPERRCSACMQPWTRSVIRALGGTAVRGALGPTCPCDAPSEVGLVLDPFMGSGTTAVAAEALGRDWLGIELNPEFVRLATDRIQAARASPRAA